MISSLRRSSQKAEPAGKAFVVFDRFGGGAQTNGVIAERLEHAGRYLANELFVVDHEHGALATRGGRCDGFQPHRRAIDGCREQNVEARTWLGVLAQFDAA